MTHCLIIKHVAWFRMWYDDSSLEKGKKIVNYINPCVFLWKAGQKKGRWRLTHPRDVAGEWKRSFRTTEIRSQNKIAHNIPSFFFFSEFTQDVVVLSTLDQAHLGSAFAVLSEVLAIDGGKYHCHQLQKCVLTTVSESFIIFWCRVTDFEPCSDRLPKGNPKHYYKRKRSQSLPYFLESWFIDPKGTEANDAQRVFIIRYSI